MKKLGKVLAAAVAALSMGLVFMGCPTGETPVTVTGISFGGTLADATDSDSPAKLTTNVAKKFTVVITKSDGSETEYEGDDLISAVEDELFTISVSDTEYLKVKGNKVTGLQALDKADAEYIVVKHTETKLKSKAYLYIVDSATKTLTEDLTVEPTSFSIEAGKTTSYKVKANYSDGSDLDVTDTATGKASTTGAVTVSAGVLTAGTTAGTYTVTFTYTEGGVTATGSTTVTVTAAGDTLESIAADSNNATAIANNASADFKIIPTYKTSGTGKAIAPTTLTAKDTNAKTYATIDGNSITNTNTTENDVKATFTAAYGDKTCEITVTLLAKSDEDDEGTGSIVIDFTN